LPRRMTPLSRCASLPPYFAGGIVSDLPLQFFLLLFFLASWRLGVFALNLLTDVFSQKVQQLHFRRQEIFHAEVEVTLPVTVLVVHLVVIA
jgi:hypothetical protein